MHHSSLKKPKKTVSIYLDTSWMAVTMYMDNLSYFYSPPQSSPPLQRTSDPGQPDRFPWSRPGNCSTPNPVKIQWYRPINMHSVWLNIIHCLKNKGIQSWYNCYIIHICVCVLSVFFASWILLFSVKPYHWLHVW